jgi:hypothetical protein
VVLHPNVLTLLLSSALICFMVVLSAGYGWQIVRRWDIHSGSELQLSLERKTYLVSTLLSYAMAFQLASLFLYIYTANALAGYFVGAMCAAGTLNATPYGFPVLLLKTANFLLAGVWLILNHADGQGYDYPLIRKKYALLLAMAPLLLAEAVLQAMHFLGMESDVITSCCGSLFSVNAKGVVSEVAAISPKPAIAAFYAVMAILLCAGTLFWRKERGGYFLAGWTVAGLAVSLVALVSFVCLYFYELPTHHCPFCILQREYGYVGYPLYLALFAGSVSGVGVGALMPCRGIRSISGTVPRVQRLLALLTVISFGLFAAISTWPIVFSRFTLG